MSGLTRGNECSALNPWRTHPLIAGCPTYLVSGQKIWHNTNCYLLLSSWGLTQRTLKQATLLFLYNTIVGVINQAVVIIPFSYKHSLNILIGNHV